MFKYLYDVAQHLIIKINIVNLRSPTGAIIATVIIAGDSSRRDLAGWLLVPTDRRSGRDPDVGNLQRGRGGPSDLQGDEPPSEGAANLHGVETVNTGASPATHLRPGPCQQGVDLAGGRDRLLADPDLHCLTSNWS